MKRLVVGLLFVALTIMGCAQNYFNIPADNFAERVKVLGVAPIFVDAESDISYPQKELLVPLVSDLNRKYEPLLVRKLHSTGNFSVVTPLADEPRQLFSKLMARREKRDDASIQYNKYFWKNDEIGSYIKKNSLDALMVVVISGLTQNSKIYSSNLLMSLETDFNFLTMTAQILGSDGTVLWEYPNFRGQLLTYYPLVNLQYPDFSESEANLSRKTGVRFKSLDGIRRTLEQKKSDWLFRETQEPEVYGKLFDDMISYINRAGDRQTKTSTVDGKPKTAPIETPKPADVSNITMPDKPVLLPKDPVQMPTSTNSTDTTVITPATNDIVPATDGNR